MNCEWIDTDAISGFRERYKTDELYRRLYKKYFVELARGICLRAECVATERLLMRNQEQLTLNKAAIVDRVVFLKKHAHDSRREDQLRMRRSLLNERLFPMHRRDVLTQRFGSWVRYYFYKRGMKEAFTCKYQVIKQQIDIQRAYKEQLAKEKDIAQASPAATSAKKPGDHLNYTAMHRHRERTIICKTCNTYYLEAQNTSMACNFHPNPFGIYCPKTCANPGLTPLCASHRIMRWRCCDSTRQVRPLFVFTRCLIVWLSELTLCVCLPPRCRPRWAAAAATTSRQSPTPSTTRSSRKSPSATR
jgi:hypothetical protein